MFLLELSGEGDIFMQEFGQPHGGVMPSMPPFEGVCKEEQVRLYLDVPGSIAAYKPNIPYL